MILYYLCLPLLAHAQLSGNVIIRYAFKFPLKHSTTVYYYSLTIPVEGVWSKIMVTQELAAEIERKTRYYSRSLSWYEERRCRITSSFFGRVCPRLSSTSPDSLVNSILNLCMYHRYHYPVPGIRTRRQNTWVHKTRVAWERALQSWSNNVGSCYNSWVFLAWS